MDVNTIYNFEASKGLKGVPSNSLNICVTSPPYYGLRDYGSSKQIGLEKTPEEYIEKLVNVFHEVKRTLKEDGTLWINISDSYSGSGKGAAGYIDNAMNYKQGTNRGTLGKATLVTQCTGCKPKDLIGIPWMLAFGLRADGWYWRDTIIWNKPSCMPESVKDRTTKSHEYILLFSKNKKYNYDYKAISEIATSTDYSIRDREHTKLNNTPGRTRMDGLVKNNYERRNKRSVWTVPTIPLREAHFATYPEKLIIDCIKAGCPENGIVLDPFMGSGTTAIVARKLNRNYIGFEINPSYIKLSEKRIKSELGFFS
ncbi:site-specific DNA-methyltransferase [uncultured Bacteroides sp.]|uniref:DNA-methyltransferase n=1 Tax=uncultured Bacteroides sp. TaxID=162156 RepID=UPI002AA8F442|nr:site-specific DNA-methyltransferase [uncultured Bacteroides sp.]